MKIVHGIIQFLFSVKPAVGLFSPMATFTVLDFIIILEPTLYAAS